MFCTPQAEGSEVSAELEFVNQQKLILNMENNALKQRFENLANEQLIKCFNNIAVRFPQVAKLSELRKFESISDPFSMYTLESNVAVKDLVALLNMERLAGWKMLHCLLELQIYRLLLPRVGEMIT
ncbi:hypothetical protein DKX38_001618 [Salix brachista]|uniref:Uncharacterized protein n=1 Tax=Salix brachista TaxID=2182728 RepID=A0A5N5P473_9ROSI|nr:hypothetical protein DKX38_001618 [Salix brachista]